MAKETTYGNISSESVKNATGRGWDEWFAVLDEAGAASMKHAEIASWLTSNHLENGWWCQGVTVGYEQARGLRKPHQRPDGFSVNVSKTIAAPVSSIYSMWVDGDERAKWLDSPREIKFSTANVNKNLRARWPDDDSLMIVYFYEKDKSRCQVVVQCEQLSAADDVEPRRTFWKNALGRLAAES